MNKIEYNSPVILSYAILSFIVMLLGYATNGIFVEVFFTAPAAIPFDPIGVMTLFTHIAGHANWSHLFGNFSLILLIGPIVEEKYGSFNLAIMIITCALITSVLNAILFWNGILGASGIVFMLIVVASFTTKGKGIPLTFMLVAFLYVGNEVISILNDDNISQFAHIIGGICGAIFGFLNGKLKEVTNDDQ